MLITGSCGIRLIVHPAYSVPSPLCCERCGLCSSRLSCRRTSRSSSSACLMFASVCLDASPPSSHHLVLGCVPPPSARPRLVPLLRFAPPSMSVPMSSRPIASRLPPRLIDTTDGATRRDCYGSRLCLLAHRFAILSVRGIGWRRGFNACLVRFAPAPCPSVPPANRSLAQSDFLAVLPSCRLIAFPPRSLDTGDGAGVLLLL